MADNIFEKVLENVDIASVVSEYVSLEPKGKNLFGLCPFHDDSNPSMSVSREKGIYYCFVCHSGGNAIKFVENYKHISSIEACKYLANEYHIDVSEFNTSLVDKNKIHYDLMDTAMKFFKFLMNDEEYSKEARAYLRKRGITDEIIKEFNIGLSPSDGESLQKTLIDKGFNPKDIELDGLINGDRDVFIDRIIVPITDEHGRTIAFGGRIYKEKDQNQAKYINSKETPIFKKGQNIFNLDKASLTLKGENPYLIINEGYMDVISAYSNGIKNSVALMGTALTDEQVELLKKYTNNVCLCLDSDNAGVTAVKSIIKKLEEYDIRYSITILNGAKDPDEFLRTYGKDKYLEQIINYRLDKFGYLYELTKRNYPKVDSFNMDSFKKDIFESMKDIDSQAVIETYLRRLSIDLKVSYESTKQDFDTFRRLSDPNYRNHAVKISAEPTFKVGSLYLKASKLIIDYSLNSIAYYEFIESYYNSRVFIEDKYYRDLFIAIGDIYDNKENITTDELILELKRRNVYKDFIYDNKVDFTLSDLENNVLRTFKTIELKEKLKLLKEKLSSLDIRSEESINIQREILRINKELRK